MQVGKGAGDRDQANDMSHSRTSEKIDVLVNVERGALLTKELVLDLARVGRLSDRRDGDGDARDLLRRLIGSEGAHRAAPAHEAPPDVLPATWCWMRVADVADVQAGFAFESSRFNEAKRGMPLVRIRDLAKTETTVWYDGPYRDEFLVRRGDFLIGMDGDFEIHRWVGGTALLNQRVCRLVFKSEAIDHHFVFLMLQRELDRIHAQTSFTTVKHLSNKQVAAIALPLPPFVEQKRIVAKVGQLTALGDELEARQARTREVGDRVTAALFGELVEAETQDALRTTWSEVRGNFETVTSTPDRVAQLGRTIADLGIRGRITDPTGGGPAGEVLTAIRTRRHHMERTKEIRRTVPLPGACPEPFPLPEGWVWCRLGDLCLQVSDGPHYSPKYVGADEGVLFLSGRNIRVGGFDFRDAKYVSHRDHDEFCKRIRPARGDILYTKGGTTGVALVNTLTVPFSVWVHVAVLRVPNDLVSPEYVAFALNSPHCYVQSQKFTHGTGNRDLGLTRMVHITLPLPPLAVQKRITAKARDLMRQCADLESAVRERDAKASRLVAALVSRLMS